jgi:hypothetical protein
MQKFAHNYLCVVQLFERTIAKTLLATIFHLGGAEIWKCNGQLSKKQKQKKRILCLATLNRQTNKESRSSDANRVYGWPRFGVRPHREIDKTSLCQQHTYKICSKLEYRHKQKKSCWLRHSKFNRAAEYALSFILDIGFLLLMAEIGIYTDFWAIITLHIHTPIIFKYMGKWVTLSLSRHTLSWGH